MCKGDDADIQAEIESESELTETNISNIGVFEDTIKYSFNNKSLLVCALTHSSYANEHKYGAVCNERLEFLGDAVLDLVVSRYIYECFEEMPEGDLTKVRAGVVCESALAKEARKIGIGDYLRLGRGEEASGGRDRDSLLADAFEAIIGAIYLDGGMESAQRYILGVMKPDIYSMRSNYKYIDCKTALQEVIQKTSKNPPCYNIVSEKGPDHDKEFLAEVCHNGRVLGKGRGKTKREAEQSAANDALGGLKSL